MARFPLNKRKKNGGRLPRERAGGLSDGARDAVHGATIRPAGPSRRLWSLLGNAIGVARAVAKRRRGNFEGSDSVVGEDGVAHQRVDLGRPAFAAENAIMADAGLHIV